jgi:hypothetical protein
MPTNTPSPDKPQKQPRPWSITLLSILIFAISLFHLLKLSQAIILWNILTSLPITISPAYLAGVGLLWGGSGLILTWGLWTGKPWSRIVSMILAGVFTAAFWIDLIWISEPEILQSRWPINLVFTVLGLAFVIITVSTASSRKFFYRNLD